MNSKYFLRLTFENLLFWLSRKIDYPLLPPDLAQVNFTFRCNLQCRMCSMSNQMEYLKREGKRTEIDSDTFKKIIRQTKELGTKTILFIGGEPFLRDDLFDLIKEAKGYGLNAIIVTNGLLLNKENIYKCFDSGVDWLSISIDAATEETLAPIRGKGVLAKIIENVERLNHLKEHEGRVAPRVSSVCTIMNDNLEELCDVVALLKRLSIHRVIFQPVVFNNADQSRREFNSDVFMPHERFPVLEKAISQLIDFKKTSPQNYDFIANTIGHLSLIKKYFKGQLRTAYPCYAGYNRLQITQDYVVYFCIPPNNDYTSSFGDVSRDSLKDLWFSPDARLRRKLIRTCSIPCLQWCAYRDGFFELSDFFYKKILFRNGHKQKNT